MCASESSTTQHKEPQAQKPEPETLHRQPEPGNPTSRNRNPRNHKPLNPTEPPSPETWSAQTLHQETPNPETLNPSTPNPETPSPETLSAEKQGSFGKGLPYMKGSPSFASDPLIFVALERASRASVGPRAAEVASRLVKPLHRLPKRMGSHG